MGTGAADRQGGHATRSRRGSHPRNSRRCWVETLEYGAQIAEFLRTERCFRALQPGLGLGDLGSVSAIAAKTLKDMEFENVAYLEGGTRAWKEAGLPTVPRSDA